MTGFPAPKFFPLIVLIFLLFPISLFAQGSLRGTVTDSTTNTPLVGANVHLRGTGLGASADLEGKYRIMGIPAGPYTLRISYIGYRAKEFQVDVTDKEKVLNAHLIPDVVEGAEFVVTGQLRGQVAAINRQVTSATIVNVVSEEKIQELPDANAAEAIGRLPGVSLIRSGGEANKVLLRGLSDRFSSVTIDGVRVPPTDADSRGVDLSMISQGSLAGVELYKALTPDKDADAIAGSINMVTKNAPSARFIRIDLKGDYNGLTTSYNQYDFAARYGERFFDDVLGVQVVGNLEKKIRSNEQIDLDYDQTLRQNTDYAINDFILIFTDEIRKRNGLSVLFDVNTPDNGSIKLSNVFSGTNRDYILGNRNYPMAGAPFYTTRYRQQDLSTFNSALSGSNYLLGLGITWGLSFAESKAEYPFDYELNFIEPPASVNGIPTAGMSGTPQIKSDPEQLVPYALNNFVAAYCTTGYTRSQNNLDKEQTAYLNVSGTYSLTSWISGELKVGGKHKVKDRFNNNDEGYAPYYLGYFKRFVRLPDGTVQPKNYDGSWNGTRFDQFFADYLARKRETPSLAEFLDSPPATRNLYEKYYLNPMISRDAVNMWFRLNKDGYDSQTQAKVEFIPNLLTQGSWYQVTERVTAAYVMNTLNVGSGITLIAGVRVERQDNDYTSKFTPVPLGTPLFPSGEFIDTTVSYRETILLPNLHLTLKPTDFLSVRLAAYRGLSRPDFNMRLEKYVAQSAGTNTALVLGNPNLKTAKAWNYEANASVYSNTIGLISLSAFYKEITDMYQTLTGAPTNGNSLLDYFGFKWREPFAGSNYSLTVPYNSPEPTKIWGFEFEHQINFDFLPGIFKNLVLTYNASLVRSETHILATRTDTSYYYIPGFDFPFPKYTQVLVSTKQRVEGEPEFFGNIALGYDVGGFSARISIYHQGEYNKSFTASSRGDLIQGSFTRVDLSLKHQFTDFLTVFLNINNLNNSKEDDSIINRMIGYSMLNTSQRYGTTADLGVRVTL